MPYVPPDQYDEHRAAAVRGIFFIVQHGTNLGDREGQHKAFSDLTSSHTFVRCKGTVIYDGVSLRALACEVAHECQLRPTPFEDAVDVLCRLSIAAVSQPWRDFYAYDPNSFSEDDLPDLTHTPKAVPESPGPRKNKRLEESYIPRAVCIVLQDIDIIKSQHKADDPDYKYKNAEHAINSIKLLMRQYDVHPGPAVEQAQSRHIDAFKVFDTLKWVHAAHSTLAKSTGKSGHARRRSKMLAMWKSGPGAGTGRIKKTYLNTIMASAALREELDGVPAYGYADHDTTWRYSAVNAAMKKLNLEINLAHSRARQTPVARKSKTSLKRELRQLQSGANGADEDAEGLSLRTPGPARMSVSVHGSPESSISPSIDNDSGMIVLGHQNLPPSVDFASASQTASLAPPLDSNVPSLTNNATTMNSSIGESPAPTTASSIAGSPTPLPDLDIDLGQIARDMRQMSLATRRLVEDLSNTLKLALRLESPFEWSAGEDLKLLYTHCLGDDWEDIGPASGKDRLAFGPEVVQELVVDYLHEHVPKDGLSWQAFIKQALGLADRLCRSLERNGITRQQYIIQQTSTNACTELSKLVEDIAMPHPLDRDYATNYLRQKKATFMLDLLATPRLAADCKIYAQQHTDWL